VFVPVAIETGGAWHHQAVELVQELLVPTGFVLVGQKNNKQAFQNAQLTD